MKVTKRVVRVEAGLGFIDGGLTRVVKDSKEHELRVMHARFQQVYI